METPIRLLTLLAVLAFCPLEVRAWWNTGHQLVAEGAIRHLPEPLATFFRAHDAYIVLQAGVEPPGTHYIDIDAYPEFDPGDPLSVARDLDTLISLHGAATVNSYGTAPWTIANYVETLTAQMAGATTPNDWLALRLTAAELAHYIGDLHNPLHLTENFNGQLTGNFGIHSRYEGQMIELFVSDVSIVSASAQCVYFPSIIDAIFDGVYTHLPFVADIMAADTLNRGNPPTYNNAYYTGMWSDTGVFTGSLFQEGSEVLASAWYTAWVNAGSPDPIFADGMGDTDADGDVDLFDYANLQSCADPAGGPPLSATCEPLDFDADGAVDTADMSAFVTVLQGP